MTHTWTAEDIARFDQDLAATSNQLDDLVETLREESARIGPVQALANTALVFRSSNQLTVQGLLLAALHRLAETSAQSGAETAFRPHRQTGPHGEPCWCGSRNHEY
jgi:hypothetical protein